MFKVECQGQWVRCPDDNCPAHKAPWKYQDCIGCYEHYQELTAVLEKRAEELHAIWEESRLDKVGP